MHIQSLLLTSFLTLSLAAGSASAETVTVPKTSHTIGASDMAISYSAQCPNRRYELRIENRREKVLFVVDNGTPRTHDISATGFGKAILHKRLYGNYGIGCGNEHAVFSFAGLEMRKAAPPKAVSAYFVIGDNGVVNTDHGLVDDSMEVINTYLTKP